MHYRRLGKSNLKVSEIGFGAWAIGGAVWGPVDDRGSIRALLTAFDNGINFVDTANRYGSGHSEKIIGKALKQTDKEISIATKVGFVSEEQPGAEPHPRLGVLQNYTDKSIKAECEESLKRLGIDSIAVYQLHCPPIDILRNGDAFKTLDELKKAGKIQNYGVSVETCEEAHVAMSYEGVSSIQVIFNLFRLKPAKEIFSEAKRKDVGIIARVPLASGLLTGKFNKETRFDEVDHRSDPSRIPGETFSGVDFELGLKAVEELRPILCKGRESMVHGVLKWILSFDTVSTVIPGCRNVKQVLMNIATSSSKGFSDNEMQACEEIYNKYFAATVDAQF